MYNSGLRTQLQNNINININMNINININNGINNRHQTLGLTVPIKQLFMASTIHGRDGGKGETQMISYKHLGLSHLIDELYVGNNQTIKRMVGLKIL